MAYHCIKIAMESPDVDIIGHAFNCFSLKHPVPITLCFLTGRKTQEDINYLQMNSRKELAFAECVNDTE